MTYEGKTQEALFYVANGVLSMISDNVFVATVYISEVDEMFQAGELTRDQFDALAIAINTGTNIPSVATPNGQAAFLFLLTSALAPLIRLSYGRMVIMAIPVHDHDEHHGPRGTLVPGVGKTACRSPSRRATSRSCLRHPATKRR